MKQLYRILPLVLSVGMVGCSNTNQPETAADKGTQEKGQDTFVSSLPADAPVLKVATTGTTPPFSFQDDYGNMQGIDIDSIRAIGEKEGFKVEFYKEAWQDMFDSVESGERDIGIAGISYNDERATKYGLSEPYYFNPAAIMYAKDNLAINSLADLQGKNVTAMAQSKSYNHVEQMGGYKTLNSQPTAFLLYEDLVQGKTDAILHDLPILQYTAKNHPEHKVNIVAYEGADNPAAQQVILMAKGNDELINKVNNGITKLKADGTFAKIGERWLGDQDAAASKNATPTSKEGA
ncbi:substrate-binding periplasmic protein [Psychrobacter aestuarii]|uniref:Basic amino acid ABC transporter substrate-binding protein n=1 Tax=Psychrobacter aestuarii TaxID=556327 RepID=A0ABP3FCE1_9GAMM|nr:transporter substrate-binding domain-containing protein [Psychrobacter aestuarii]